MTASWAAVNAPSTPKLKEAREEGDVVLDEGRRDQKRGRDQRCGDDGLRRYERAPVTPAEGAGQLPVLAQRPGQPREARDRGRDGDEQDQRAGEADVHAERRRQAVGQRAAQRVHDSHQRRVQPLGAEGRRAAGGRKRGERHEGDRHVDHDDEADPGEEAARQVPPRLAGLLGEIGDGLEARVGEHRERQREDDLVPARVRPDRDAVGQRFAGEEEREAEHDEHQLRREVEHRDEDPVAVERGAPHQPHRRDAHDHRDPDDDVPGVVLERLRLGRPPRGSAA